MTVDSNATTQQGIQNVCDAKDCPRSATHVVTWPEDGENDYCAEHLHLAVSMGATNIRELGGEGG